MADSVNMSLDDIIKKSKQQRISRSRGRGGGASNIRGRGGGRGGRGRGRGGGGPNTRSGTPGPNRGRSQSRGSQNRSRSRSRAQSQNRAGSQSRNRSRSRQRFRSNSRARSNSRGRSVSRGRRGLTPRGRAGLEDQDINMPPLVRTKFGRGRGRGRGGQQNGLRRSNSNPNLRDSVHNRLGVTTRRGKPLAVAKRGISKRGRGSNINNRYSAVGLRSDEILQQQRRHLILQNNLIRSQTFTRSRSRSRTRNNSFSSPNQLTVSVVNDFSKRRRNSVGNAGYLTQQNLQQLNNQFGGYNTRRGPGSVKSMASNRSNQSNRSTGSNRSRGRGGNRGGNRGVPRKFAKQVLNPQIQKEIAVIQGRSSGPSSNTTDPLGVNFAPTPAATRQTLHERFGCS